MKIRNAAQIYYNGNSREQAVQQVLGLPQTSKIRPAESQGGGGDGTSSGAHGPYR